MPDRVGSASQLPEALPALGWSPVGLPRTDEPDDPIRYTRFSRPSRWRFDLFGHILDRSDAEHLRGLVARVGRRAAPPRGTLSPEAESPQSALPPPVTGGPEPTTVFEVWG